MQFRTEVEVDVRSDFFNHESKIIGIGSCFSSNIGECLIKRGFDYSVNPFGILFNGRIRQYRGSDLSMGAMGAVRGRHEVVVGRPFPYGTGGIA